MKEERLIMQAKYGFGDLLLDKVSGFQGIVMGITMYATGCISYGVAPQVTKEDGSLHFWEWIDEIRLELKKEEAIKFVKRILEPTPPGGLYPHPLQGKMK